MTRTTDPLVVGVLYPDWYHGDDEWRGIEAALVSIDPRVEVVRVPYEEPTELRAARGTGVVVDLAARAPALTPAQRDGMSRIEVALAMDLPPDVASVAPRLRWVQGVGAGVGQLLSSGLADAGIRLTNGVGLSAASIAEFVIGRLLAVWKDFDRLARLQAAHDWGFAHGRTFTGSTIGIVGLGAIGQAIAARLTPFGVTVLGCRRDPNAGPVPGVDEVVGTDDLDLLSARADAVIAAVPATPDTTDLFDRARFAAMKPGAVFVNVGRGSAVVEADLIAALDDGHLGAAVLDVTRTEPLPADDPLWDAPRLFLSPHAAAAVDRYLENLHDLFRDNVARYVAGDSLRNEVDPALGY
jgi:phosphoglycerate dehydrogenase-like enzyme